MVKTDLNPISCRSNGLLLSSRFFYTTKNFIPRGVQIAIRRRIALKLREKVRDIWPIDPSSAAVPEGWQGWPGQKKFAIVLTHDVESPRGLARCKDLAQLEMKIGFRSSYNFVPKKYEVSSDLRAYLDGIGFEVGVHGLYHDGKYFKSEKIWAERSLQINEYLSKWKAVGFRTPSMLHNLEKFLDLKIEYDASTFDTDPFEPQPDGMKTIFPFCVFPEDNKQKGYIELPYTLPQDFTVFIILGEEDVRIWKDKVDWIASHGGMVLLNVHPDYIRFNSIEKEEIEQYPISYYTDFLLHIQNKYKDQYWNALPRDVARYYREFREKTPINPPNPGTRAKLKKYRICMLAYTFYESDGRVSRYAKSLVEEGHHVDMIALRRDGQLGQEIIDGVQVHRLQRRNRDEKNVFSYVYRLCKFFILSLIKISRLHIQHPYDIVHVHNMPDFLVFAALLPKIKKSKIVLDIHDIMPEFYKSKFKVSDNNLVIIILKFIEKLSAKFSDYVIVANHIWDERLKERSVPPDKCSVIMNYPDITIFSKKVNQNINDKEKEFKLVYPGSLNWHQGVDIAIRAMAIIRDSIPRARLHIFGEGKEKNALEELSCILGVKECVIFHNRLSLQEISEEIAAADLGIVPKRAEGFGNEAFSTKILEFMALGIPVIASSTRIDRYYFNDSMITFFESGNEKELAKSVIAACNNPDRQKVITQNAFQYVMENNWDVKKNKYFNIIDGLLGS